MGNKETPEKTAKNKGLEIKDGFPSGVEQTVFNILHALFIAPNFKEADQLREAIREFKRREGRPLTFLEAMRRFRIRTYIAQRAINEAFIPAMEAFANFARAAEEFNRFKEDMKL